MKRKTEKKILSPKEIRTLIMRINKKIVDLRLEQEITVKEANIGSLEFFKQILLFVLGEEKNPVSDILVS